MTPAARLAAAIAVLDAVRSSTAPAAEVLRAWGRARRFAGSKDRRAIAERVYAVLRARTRLAWSMGEDGGRALVLAALRQHDRLDICAIEALFSGLDYAPEPLAAQERERLRAPETPPPDWIAAGVPAFVVPMLQAHFGDAW